MTFSNRTVMVTGAAGNLGRAVARAFADLGANLALIDRHLEHLKRAFGVESERQLFLPTDLLDQEQVHAAARKAIERFKRIDVLCNIAGGFRMGEPVHETSDENWNFLFGINARTVLHTARAVVPQMLESGGGKIVNIGAYAAQKGVAKMGAYCASKSAVIRLTEAMAAELREKNINVNCVLPTIIDTPENRAAMPDADPTPLGSARRSGEHDRFSLVGRRARNPWRSPAGDGSQLIQRRSSIMPTRISDIHIERADPLPEPRLLRDELPAGEAEASHIAASRAALRRILRGEDDRLLVIAGPCSIHEPESALEYAGRLAQLAERVADSLFLVMRVYFEKPRTRMGWKGLIYDPSLDGQGNIGEGLRHARRILLECARLGVPAASEILDLVTPQYYAELLTWGAIGARTVESPLHRQMASALSAPVGFKNATNGSVSTAIDAIHVAAQPHRFPTISLEGKAMVITTTGNPDCHLVLRGSHEGPNYDAASVGRAAEALTAAGLPARVIVDCSHGNSGKDYLRQPAVAADVAGQVAAGSSRISGVLLESHLVEGRQDIRDGRKGLRYGQSVTDACIGWEATVAVLERLAASVELRRRAHPGAASRLRARETASRLSAS